MPFVRGRYPCSRALPAPEPKWCSRRPLDRVVSDHRPARLVWWPLLANLGSHLRPRFAGSGEESARDRPFMKVSEPNAAALAVRPA